MKTRETNRREGKGGGRKNGGKTAEGGESASGEPTRPERESSYATSS